METSQADVGLLGPVNPGDWTAWDRCINELASGPSQWISRVGAMELVRKHAKSQAKPQQAPAEGGAFDAGALQGVITSYALAHKDGRLADAAEYWADIRATLASLTANPQPKGAPAAEPAPSYRRDYPTSEKVLGVEHDKAREDERLYGVGFTVNGWHVPAPVVAAWGMENKLENEKRYAALAGLDAGTAPAVRYTSAMGAAADAYINKQGGRSSTLPALFRWEECLAAMLAAGPAPVQSTK